MKMKIFLFIFWINTIFGLITEYDKLVFEENFDNETAFLSRWEYDLGNGDNGWGNAELEYYRKNKANIFIENNQLHIKAKVEDYGKQHFTSAKITTKHSFQFTYGKVEAKIKLPSGNGIWPAFWMLGANIDEVGWPSCGEIDILESKNIEQNIYSTLHFSNEKGEYANKGNNKPIDNINDFHIYSLTWTKDEIIMNVDQIEILKVEQKDLKITSFTKPFYLILNLAVGGNFPATEVDKSVFPLEMIVDYIKIYQETENYKYLEKHLIFYDDFDGKELDRTKWAYDIGTGQNGWGTGQKQYYTNRKDNIFLSNSSLIIRAKKENYEGCEYTSGKLTTKYNMKFGYGILETKIKFPSVDGVSPGLWLSGLYNNNVWPKCGEIDALIGKDKNNRLISGCYWDENKSYYLTSDLDITNFNEYSIVWDKNYITIYSDDLEIYKIDIKPDELIAFHDLFYLNLNVLVGGSTVDKNIDDSAFPLEMLVDYVKIYQYELKNEINPEVYPADNAYRYLGIKLYYNLMILILILLW